MFFYGALGECLFYIKLYFRQSGVNTGTIRGRLAKHRGRYCVLTENLNPHQLNRCVGKIHAPFFCTCMCGGAMPLMSNPKAADCRPSLHYLHPTLPLPGPLALGPRPFPTHIQKNNSIIPKKYAFTIETGQKICYYIKR